jgi:N-acylneuraminate cytidylyltransferase
MENGAFYFTNRDVLSNFSCRLGGKMGVFEMDAETAVEIDEPEDWAIIEQILKKREMQ